MSLPQVILDTDILSALMWKNAAVVVKAKAYLAQHNQFTLSIITRYEILRGLKAKGAQLERHLFTCFLQHVDDPTQRIEYTSRRSKLIYFISTKNNWIPQ